MNWDVSVAGELECEDCSTSDFVPKSGTVTTGLSGLPGETGRVASGLTFAAFDPQADGRDRRRRAVGRSRDGVPGDEPIIRFADGSDTTLE